MSLPTLSGAIGAAEHSMRALLERELSKEQIDFPAWTALVFTWAAPLSGDEIARRHVAGHILPDVSLSHAAIARLIEQGIVIKNAAGLIEHSAKGRQKFAELSASVNGITGDLYGDLPQFDVDVTHRTLIEISQRATRRLGAG